MFPLHLKLLVYSAVFVKTSADFICLTLKSINATCSSLIELGNVCVGKCFQDKLEHSLMERIVRDLLDFNSHMREMIYLQNVAFTKMENVNVKQPPK
jgi:hypothetical protein